MYFSTAGPAELEGMLTQLQRALDELKSTAPSEITADVDTVAKFIGAQISALAELDYDYSQMMNDPDGQDATQALSSDEFGTALRNLNNYIATQCHTSTAEPGPVPAEMCPEGDWPVAAAYELETGNFQWTACTAEGGCSSRQLPRKAPCGWRAGTERNTEDFGPSTPTAARSCGGVTKRAS